jgi:hypothetical protein
MALTIEVLKANSVLSGLSDEQLAAITTLSVNDENSVIAQKTGKIYGDLDADILSVTGIAKNGTEKTYDYAKRVLGEFKTKAESAVQLQGTIDTLTKEKLRLEKAIQDGASDAETAKALKQAKADLDAITGQYNELNAKFQNAEQKHQKELFGIRVESTLQSATANLKFKPELPGSVTKVLLNQVTEKIKNMHPELIDDGKGGQIIAFKDENGAVMRNPNNQLNPYTADELIQRELETMGVLDKGRQQSGGGTQQPAGGSGTGGTVIDVTGAKTRAQAYDMIASSLMAQGLTNGSKEFQSGMDQAWKENNISSLPEK